MPKGTGAEMVCFLKARLKIGFAADGRKILPQIKVSGRIRAIPVMIIQGAGAEMDFLRVFKARLKIGFASQAHPDVKRQA